MNSFNQNNSQQNLGKRQVQGTPQRPTQVRAAQGQPPRPQGAANQVRPQQSNVVRPLSRQQSQNTQQYAHQSKVSQAGTTKQEPTQQNTGRYSDLIESLDVLHSGNLADERSRKKGRRAAGVVLGLAALTAVAVPVTIFVNRATDTTEYEIVVNTEFENAEKYSVSIKKGSTIAKLKTKFNVIQGHTLVGVYKDAEFTQPYSDTDKVSPSTQVYLKYEKQKYTIKLPNSSYYKIECSEQIKDNKAQLEWGDSFVFWIDYNLGYTGENLQVTANGELITPTEQGYYILNFVEDNIEIKVTSTISAKKYSLSLSQANNNITIYRASTNNSSATTGEITPGTNLYYGDMLHIYYSETEGYKKTKFAINGVEHYVDAYDKNNENTVVRHEVSANVAIDYEEQIKTFDLILPNGEGYTLKDADGINDLAITNPLNWGTEVKFKLDIAEGYTTPNKVMYAGQELAADSEVYTIVVKENSAIEVSGVVKKKYLVSFKSGNDIDAITLKSEIVSHGDQITAYANQEQVATAQYKYEFKGWVVAGGSDVVDFDNLEVKSDLIFVPYYQPIEREYNVQEIVGDTTNLSVKVNDGTVLGKLKYNEIITVEVTVLHDAYIDTVLSLSGLTIESSTKDGNVYTWICKVVGQEDAENEIVSYEILGIASDESVVSLTVGEGYNLTFVKYDGSNVITLPGTTQAVEKGNYISFKVDVLEGYKSTGYAVKKITLAPGVTHATTLDPDDNGVYTIEVESSTEIIVENIELLSFTLKSHEVPDGFVVSRRSSRRDGASLGQLESGDTIYYHDELEISYVVTPGYETTEFTINGLNQTIDENLTEYGFTIQVNEDVEIKCVEQIKNHKLIISSEMVGYALLDTEGNMFLLKSEEGGLCVEGVNLNIENSFTFSLNLLDGYTHSQPRVRIQNPTAVFYESDTYVYTISNATGDVVISVEGIELNKYQVIAPVSEAYEFGFEEELFDENNKIFVNYSGNGLAGETMFTFKFSDAYSQSQFKDIDGNTIIDPIEHLIADNAVITHIEGDQYKLTNVTGTVIIKVNADIKRNVYEVSTDNSQLKLSSYEVAHGDTTTLTVTLNEANNEDEIFNIYVQGESGLQTISSSDLIKLGKGVYSYNLEITETVMISITDVNANDYSVILPASQVGYTISSEQIGLGATFGEVTHGQVVTLSLLLHSSHNQSTPKVRANGSILSPIDELSAGDNLVYQYIVNSDVEITVDDVVRNEYAVTFKDWDGDIISQQIVKHGYTAAIPDSPSRKSDSRYNYTFNGWDTNASKPIIRNEIFTAEYDGSYINYQVTLMAPEHSKITATNLRTNEKVVADGSSRESTKHINKRFDDEVRIQFEAIDGYRIKSYTGSISNTPSITNPYSSSSISLTIPGETAGRAYTCEVIEVRNLTINFSNIDEYGHINTGSEVFTIDKDNITIYSQLNTVDSSGELIHCAAGWTSADGSVFYDIREATCGLFLDEALTKPMPDDMLITQDLQLYTKRATLNKLTYIGAEVSAKDTSISGDVVIPMKYNTGARLSTITAIAKEGFMSSYISSITLPTGIKIVGEYAASYCSSLTSINLPEGLEEVGNSAFSESNVKNLNVPASVILFGAQYATNSLEKITVSPANEKYYSGKLVDGEWVEFNCIIDKSTQTLIRGCADSIIPEGVKHLDYGAFSYNSPTDVKLPSTLETIGNYCFCTVGVEFINIPASVTRIGYGAFADAFDGECEIIFEDVWGWHLDDGTAISPVDLKDAVEAVNQLSTHTQKWTKAPAVSLADAAPSWFELNDDGQSYKVVIKETGWNGPTDTIHLVVPSIYNGKPVTKVCNDFLGIDPPILENVMSIYFEEGIKSIDEMYYNHAMEYVYIPKSMNSIYRFNANYLIFEENSTWIYEGETTVSVVAWGKCDEHRIKGYPATKTKVCTQLNEYWFEYDEGSDGYRVVNAGYLIADSIEIPSIYNDGIHGLKPVTKIDDGAFNCCYELGEVVIPSSVTSIGNYAFSSCESLSSVDFGSNSQLQSIGNSAFAYCTSLTSITIPSTVISIGNAAFNGCSALTDIVIPDGVTSIGRITFQQCDSLTSIIIPSSVKSIESDAFYHCNLLSNVQFASGSQLETIGPWAFKDCAELTRVDIPSSVTSIGNNAFEGCSNLTDIILQKGLESIGNNAFASCTALRTVAIPGSVTFIGDNVFKGSDKLSVVNIGSSSDRETTVLQLGENVFARSSSTSEQSELNIYVYKKEITLNKEMFTDCTTVNLMLRDGCETTIDNDAFKNFTALKKIELTNNSSIDIGDSAFNGCTGLANISIYQSDSISIGSSAFSDCTALERLEISAKTLSDTETSISNNAFKGCTALESITMQRLTTSINSTVFAGCPGITSLAITNCDITIGENAFSNKDQLETVTIRNSTTALGERAFEGCSLLNKVSIAGGETSIGSRAFILCSALRDVTLGGTITSLGNYAFAGTTGLTSITLPTMLQSIGERAFDRSGLTRVTIPNGVTSIGESAFYKCKSLTSIIISSSVTSIAASTFEGCTSLATVTIHLGVTSIGASAFKGCTSLTGVTISASVTSIGASAFEGCTSLGTVTIPANVTAIGAKAFKGCSALVLKFARTASWEGYISVTFTAGNNYASYFTSGSGSDTSWIRNAMLV